LSVLVESFVGKLSYRGKWWFIEAEPHVVLKLKRIFPRVESHASGEIAVSDSLEIARDLEWFRQRYPLEMNGLDEQYLEKRAAEHTENETLVSKLMAGQFDARDFEMALPPRDYQRVAAELWLRKGSLLVGDEIGVGKTVTAICGITHKELRPALVVTYTHLTGQWEREINRFAPQLRTHVIRYTTPYDVTKRPQKAGATNFVHDGKLPDVMIMSYHKLDGWARVLSGIAKSLILDEGQELRRGDEALKGKAAKLIASKCLYRTVLSATPVINFGGEIWNIFNVIAPDALGTWQEFKQEWCSAGMDDASKGKWRIKDPKAFGTYLRREGLMLRRTRADVGREIEPLTKIVHHIDHDERVMDEVEDAARALAERFLLNPDPKQARYAGGQLNAIVRKATGVAKAAFVADFVRLLLEQEARVVMFGYHRDVYSTWLERLKPFNPVLFTGSESPAQKEESKRLFVEGDSRVLIISLRSGAGLDGLQFCCRTVVHGELDWSPKFMEQADGRVHRDGQVDPVMSYYLLSTAGSDPLMADLLNMKDAQSRSIVDPERDAAEKFDAPGPKLRQLAEAYLFQLDNRAKHSAADGSRKDREQTSVAARHAPRTPQPKPPPRRDARIVTIEDKKPKVLLGVDVSFSGLGLVAVPILWQGDWTKVESLIVEGKLEKASTDNERAAMMTHVAGCVCDFALEHGCSEAWIEAIPTHDAFSLTKLAGLDAVVRVELLRDGIDIRSAHMSTTRALLLGKLPKKPEGAKRGWIKPMYIEPALRAAGCPFMSREENDVRDAWVAVQAGLAEHGGFFFCQSRAA